MAKTKNRYATHITLPSGKRVYVSATSQKELDDKVYALKIQSGIGIDISDKTTFKDLANLWMTVYKKPKITQQSYDILESRLRCHIVSYFGDMVVREIKPVHIQGFLASIASLKKTMQAALIQMAKSIFDVAVDNNIIVRSPMKKSDKASGESTSKREALTDEQIAELFDYAKFKPEAYTFCLLALCTGMRKGEIMALRWDCVDFDERTIHIARSYKDVKGGDYNGSTKTEYSDRFVPIPQNLYSHLKELKRNTRSMYVLEVDGKPITKNHIEGLFNNMNRHLDFHVHPHLLRHTYCTSLIENGVQIKAVQHLLGHSTPNITMSVYAHYREKMEKEKTANQVSEILRMYG